MWHNGKTNTYRKNKLLLLLLLSFMYDFLYKFASIDIIDTLHYRQWLVLP